MAEEAKKDAPKLGPSATYTNRDGSAKAVTMQGVRFEEGKAVDLVKEIGEARAAPLLAKLANNPYFEVRGAPKPPEPKPEPGPEEPDEDEDDKGGKLETPIGARGGPGRPPASARK